MLKSIFFNIKTVIIFLSGALTSVLIITIWWLLFSQIKIWHFLIFLFFLGQAIYLLGKHGYLNHFSWLSSKKRRIEKVLQIFEGFSQNSGNESPNFTINDTERSASMVYTRYSKQYIVNLPYDRKLLGKMNRYSAILLKRDERKDQSERRICEEIDITQQPGVIYTCTASQLGGEKIVFVDKIEGRILTVFGPNDIPRLDNL